MANSATTKAARTAARKVVTAAQEELARRQRANVEDLAKFFAARDRIEETDRWEAERLAVVRAQASQRRAAQESQCAAALQAMRDRGEDLAEIARLTGIDQKAVRERIKMAEQTPRSECEPAAGHERNGQASTAKENGGAAAEPMRAPDAGKEK